MFRRKNTKLVETCHLMYLSFFVSTKCFKLLSFGLNVTVRHAGHGPRQAKPSTSVSISNFNFQTFLGSLSAYPILTRYAAFIASENLCQHESCLFFENESAVVFAVYNPRLAASLGYIKLPSNQVSLCNSSASLHFNRCSGLLNRFHGNNIFQTQYPHLIPAFFYSTSSNSTVFSNRCSKLCNTPLLT